MNIITVFLNFLKGFRKLKVKAIVGNYAIVVDQKDRFVGIVSALIVGNQKDFWGKRCSETINIPTGCLGSYKHNVVAYPITPYNEKNNSWWCETVYKDIAIIDCYKSTPIYTGKGSSIAVNFSGHIDIPLVNILS